MSYKPQITEFVSLARRQFNEVHDRRTLQIAHKTIKNAAFAVRSRNHKRETQLAASLFMSATFLLRCDFLSQSAVPDLPLVLTLLCEVNQSLVDFCCLVPEDMVQLHWLVVLTSQLEKLADSMLLNQIAKDKQRVNPGKSMHQLLIPVFVYLDDRLEGWDKASRTEIEKLLLIEHHKKEAIAELERGSEDVMVALHVLKYFGVALRKLFVMNGHVSPNSETARRMLGESECPPDAVWAESILSNMICAYGMARTACWMMLQPHGVDLTKFRSSPEVVAALAGKMQGPLKKRSPTVQISWQARYAVLSSTSFSYWRSQDESQNGDNPRGVIPLANIQSVEEDAHSSRFKIHTIDKPVGMRTSPVYTWEAKDQWDRTAWLEAIAAARQAYHAEANPTPVSTPQKEQKERDKEEVKSPHKKESLPPEPSSPPPPPEPASQRAPVFLADVDDAPPVFTSMMPLPT